MRVLDPMFLTSESQKELFGKRTHLNRSDDENTNFSDRVWKPSDIPYSVWSKFLDRNAFLEEYGVRGRKPTTDGTKGYKRDAKMLLPFLRPDTKGELSDFLDALPSESDYDVWNPSESDLKDIMIPSSYGELPSGYERPKMTTRGQDIKESLDAHRAQIGKYRAFKDKIEMLNSMVKDPEQKGLFYEMR